MSEIHELEIAAVAGTSEGNLEEATNLIRRATALEEAMGSPPGPPIKPSHELYGEILLRAGRHSEAVQQFARSLIRYPNRAHSLLGAARAAAQSGDTQRAAAPMLNSRVSGSRGTRNCRPCTKLKNTSNRQLRVERDTNTETKYELDQN